MKELKKKEENDGFVLIDTWWNVNSSAAEYSGTVACFNRYMVECKLA